MLFTPIKIKDITIKNRIMMSPMCQYSAGKDGLANNWHFVHYVSRAVGGVGLIMIEATAVESRGRITDRDLGIWNDQQVESLKKIVEECKKYGATMGIQLAHAGRKSEVTDETPVAPSSINWSDDYKLPHELTKEEINTIVEKFKDAAARALAAGFDVVEVHAAHGYLLHEFLSPLSNKRSDEYGGDVINRVRVLKEVIEAIKKVWPENKPLFVRVSSDDYIEGGIDIDEMIRILSHIKPLGVDVIDASSGGLLNAKIDLYPGYQVKYSEKIKSQLGFKTAAVGLITKAEMAEQILKDEKADIIALGRELLRNPYWPLYAAHDLKEDVEWPKQYERGKFRV
ncbi:MULTISPECIES: NADPH dehydrogenase NamA [Thermoanaerobacterium]|uniref:NADH:flavin oxidoreductase n=2 Tax=Thermoanaerobacterium TaxID=28895 RepID=W9E9X8_9THEO|nr:MULTISPECIES: NADPH dehydrogenase NamA [Thermoanaerobacterium]AFK87460.1 NADH:flavin oxidoreductase/NADH oxidase [Thermoanaerobacterium saccharolyticum JW/SL-YS485]ETO37710.1 NADH:flavin oxidoreductase [Thermoanaerobacterium aotearoense SCUT27]